MRRTLLQEPPSPGLVGDRPCGLRSILRLGPSSRLTLADRRPTNSPASTPVPVAAPSALPGRTGGGATLDAILRLTATALRTEHQPASLSSGSASNPRQVMMRAATDCGSEKTSLVQAGTTFHPLRSSRSGRSRERSRTDIRR